MGSETGEGVNGGIGRFSAVEAKSPMIALREYTDSDIDRLVELANNENVSRYLVSTFPFPYTMEDAAWWIATGSKHNGAITRVIEYQGLFVGWAQTIGAKASRRRRFRR